MMDVFIVKASSIGLWPRVKFLALTDQVVGAAFGGFQIYNSGSAGPGSDYVLEYPRTSLGAAVWL